MDLKNTYLNYEKNPNFVKVTIQFSSCQFRLPCCAYLKFTANVNKDKVTMGQNNSCLTQSIFGSIP